MEKIDKIQEYIVRMNRGNENLNNLFKEFEKELLSVHPLEAFDVFQKIKLENFSELEILPFLDKIVHVFFDNLRRTKPNYENLYPYIDEMLQDNRLLEKTFDKIRPLMTKLDILNVRQEMVEILDELKQFYPHYEKKENLLFPLMESKHERFLGLSIMWALHNKVKQEIDDSILLLSQESTSKQELIESISQLFFDMLGLIQKEEYILIPAALEVLSPDQWKDLYGQSAEYNGVFNTRESVQNIESSLDFTFEDYTITTQTGQLKLDQVLMIFNVLEMDMTLVDENNKVCYFTHTKNRIFPRSFSVIGREVKNCHPPQSVHIVEEIVENFRAGKEDKASFWIDMKGRKILIQYFALRDNLSNYRGVLEVSQDITMIQKLEGQQRLAQYAKL